ncbi:MAG: hypothetical protein Q8N94_08535 [Methanoregula sp.]|nr:hypothetical protein [Methanoregula sp.]
MTPTPTSLPVSGAGACTNTPWNEKCYDSAYDFDGDCHMTRDDVLSVCGNKIKYPLGNTGYYALIDYEGGLAVYPWDCGDKYPAVWACENVTAADCKNQSYMPGATTARSICILTAV